MSGKNSGPSNDAQYMDCTSQNAILSHVVTVSRSNVCIAGDYRCSSKFVVPTSALGVVCTVMQEGKLLLKRAR